MYKRQALPAGLSINSSTGAITPSTSTAGTYTVTYTIPSSGGCAAVPVTTSVTITTLPVATFSYTGTPYCSNAANPSPTFSGGGVAGTFSSTAGLNFISTSTGQVNLSTSTAGTYTVTNTIAASGGCPLVTASSPITITTLPTATISYAGTPFCKSVVTPQAVTFTGTTGGTYTASPIGLTIDAGTGAISPSSSTPGTYTVTYTIAASGGCSVVTATTSVTITVVPTATISYAGTPFCKSVVGSQPVTFSGTTGGTYSAAPGGLTIDAGTGAITPSSSTPGTYTVTYTIAASGGCSVVTATTSVTITAVPTATISYSGTPFCTSVATAQSVTLNGTGAYTGGVYSSTAGLSINSSTGAITPSTSTAGTYTITYTIPSSGGCAAVPVTTSVTITTLPVATFSYTGTPYCSNAANPSPTFSGGGVAGIFSSTAGLNFVSTSTGQVNLSTSTAGTYTVTNTITAAGGCGQVTSSNTITITTLPTATISYAGTPFCASVATPQSVTLNGTGAYTGGTYSSTGGLTLNASTGAITPSTSTVGTYTVTYTVPASNGCVAVPVTTSVTITATPTAIISYSGTPFCTSISSPQSPTLSGSGAYTGGVYSSTAGLSINSSTGAITPSTSTAGIYTVTYTVPASGGCAAVPVTTSVTITTLPVATFSYTGTPYCSDASDPLPTFSGGGTAGTFSSTTGLIFVSTSTGQVDLNLSTSGTYTVTNTIAASGGCGIVTATSLITITTLPVATISYPGSPFFVAEAPQSVVQTGNSGGSYSASPPGLTINSSTGLITPSTSTPGTYTVTYTIAPAGGCAAVTATTMVTILVGDIILVSGSNNADGYYGSLTNTAGAFSAINAQNQTGKTITVTIAKSSLAETGANALNAGLWTSINIYPTGSSVIISGNVAGPLINLNGADNVTIDGRIGATGATPDMIITNPNTGTSSTTIQFINTAENNTVKYCTIKGAETSATKGIITYSTASAGNGNDGNIIDHNNITGDAAGRPVNAIYSAGSAGYENSGGIISNNNIYDIWRNASGTSGIQFGASTTDMTITNNNFYESTTIIPAGAYTYSDIYISNTSGNNFVISGNYMGGQAAQCGGSALTVNAGVAHLFQAIYLNVGATTASSVQNNTIRNFIYTSSSLGPWQGINVAAGAVNIGTVTGNTIGSTTGTGSVTVTGSATGTNIYGINIAGTGTVDCENNKIGSVTANNTSANASNIYAVNRTNTGITIISNNTFGSTSTPGSINASSASSGNAQSVIAVNNTGTGTVTINGNIIANLVNATSNVTAATAGLVNGIVSTNGTNTISNNTIHDLAIANANTSSTNTAAVCGIALTGTTLKTVSGNTIYNLSNSFATFAGNIIGIYFTGATGTNVVSGNFINSLSVTGSTSVSATVYGIKIAAGATNYYNNIISLGGNTTTTIYGMYETGAANNNNNLYFNTIYISGTPTSGALNSYALYSAVTTNTRNFRDNIFDNARSNSGATGSHFAMYILSTGGTITADFNDYLAPGTGGILGYYGANKTVLPIVSAQDVNSMISIPGFANAGGTNATDYYPSSQILAGTFIIGFPTDYAGITRSGTPTIGAYEGVLNLNVDVYKLGVYQATYVHLKDAFDKINNGFHTGALEVRIKANTTETTTATLYQSGYNSGSGISNYTSVKIFPTLSGISVSGNLALPLIDLNGADNVVIDGRVNAAGTLKDLVINNSSTSAAATTSTIRFINDASTDTIRYCTIRGSETYATSGVILFSTTTAAIGNDNNLIDNNNITSSTDANRPLNAIYSAGTTAKENSGITISNNNFYDFLNRATASNGITLAGFTNSCTISGNSFYETTSFVASAAVAFNVIYINNTSGTGFSVTGNYIGGKAPLCGGAAWTKTGQNTAFTGINVNAATGGYSNVQNNTIQNFSWTNAGVAAWTGINVQAGDVNIGTTTGNTIGSATGTGSITYTSTTTGAFVYGINIPGAGTVDCENNIIGSITGANASTLATNVYGISKAAVAGTTIISNNTIGSLMQANSIQASSASTSNPQSLFGIANAGTGTITINGNTIANLKNGTTNGTATTTGLINGITSSNGTNTISNNIIHDLFIANANTTTTNTASVCGIALTGATQRTVTGNTIYNLSNGYTSFLGYVYGIYFTGGAGTNDVSGNTIYGLGATGATAGAAFITGIYVTTGLGTNTISRNFIYGITAATSSTASIYGIRIAAGSASYFNNIISLGTNAPATIYGIFETGIAGTTNNIYFNTIYIGGTPATAALKSYALYSAVNTNTRDFRNNILYNARSNSGSASGNHFALYIVTTAGTLTVNYNDYTASGTGGILGYYGANKGALPIVTGQDGASITTAPGFINPGGTAATDYKISVYLLGTVITGITTDYGSITRDVPPGMGAWEKFLKKWKGSISTNFGTGGNWTDGIVPSPGENVIFDNSPVRDCFLDADRTIGGLTINQSVEKMVLNGFKLSVGGSLALTSGGQIDARSAGSTIAFSGSSPQTIGAGTFVNDSVFNFTMSNSSGVSQNGNTEVNGTLTLSGGILTLGSGIFGINGSIALFSGSVTAGATSTVRIGGSGIQLTIPANTFTGNSLGNFTINRAAGAVLGSNLSVSGVLNLQTGNPSATVGSLETGSYVITMGASATTTGPGDVNGTVTRSSFAANVPYTFGNAFTTLTFGTGGTMPTGMGVRINIGIAPAWKADAIQRTYDIVHTGGSGAAVSIHLHYLDSELNGNPEADLYPWDYDPTANPVMLDKLQRTGSSATDNWVATTVPSATYFATAFSNHTFTLAKSIYVTFAGVKGWRMITTPTLTTSADLLTGFISQGVPGSSYPAKQPNFLWFDETDTLTTNMSWRTSVFTNNLVKGRGYYFYVFDSVSGSYSDTLPRQMTASGNGYFPGTFSYSGSNQHLTYTRRVGGQISQSPTDTIFYDTNIDDQGWNLLGNPTLQTLNWDVSGGWTRSNVDNTIYIWDPAFNEFRVWNGVNGSLGNGLISPYQAFWVKANGTNPTMSFTNSALTTGGFFYGGSAVKSQQANAGPSAINLSLNSAGLQGSAMITFMDDGKVGPDEWDAYRLEPLTDSWMELFSLSSPAHTMPLVINNLPANGGDYINLPLFTGGQKHGQSLNGTYTLNWELPSDWPSDWAITLDDHLNKTAISMRNHQSHTFELSGTKSISSGPDTALGVPVLPGRIMNPVSHNSLLKSSTQLPPFSIVIQKGVINDDPVYYPPTAKLLQNYPNPFTSATSFRFSLPVATWVSLKIYDIYGKEMDVVADRYFNAGIYTVTWSGQNIKPGMYMLRMKTDATTDVVKLVKIIH